jgi:two-component sensor histidine kinase
MLQTEGFNRQTVWIEEAMHRAANLQHLAASLDRLLNSGGLGSSDRLRAIRRAEALVDTYDNLTLTCDTGPRSCTQELRDIAGGVVEIFGHTVGSFVLSLELQPLLLAGEVRRALLLAASELVVNALLHGFVGRQAGTIQVRLCHDQTARKGVLFVADDGAGPENRTDSHGLSRHIVRHLADVLDGDVVWRQSLSLGGTEAMLRFPVPVSASE